MSGRHQQLWGYRLQPGLTMKLAATFLTGGESKEVRAREELYYRTSLDTIAVLERGKTLPTKPRLRRSV